MSLDYINHQPLDQTVVIVSAAHLETEIRL